MIVLAVAPSGIVATLLSSGKTAHSTFKLPSGLTNNDELDVIKLIIHILVNF